MAQKILLCEGNFNQDMIGNEPLAGYIANGYEVKSVGGFASQDNKSMCFVLLDKEASVAVPTFALAPGESSASLTITCSTASASIYYTTDGSTPTSASTAYSAAVTLSATTTVKAIAIKDGVESEVGAVTYTAPATT